MNKLNKECQICNSKKHTLLDTYSSGYIFIPGKFKKIKFDKWICNNCSHIFNKKIISFKTINEHYKTARSNKILTDHEYKNIAKTYYESLAKVIIKNTKLNKKKKFIDVGCGRGYLLFAMTKLLKSENIFGLDMSIDAKNLVIPKLKSKIITKNFLEIKSEKFDVISLISVLEHFDDINLPIEKAFQILNPKGYLCITVPDSMKILYDDEGRKLAFAHDLLNYEHNHHFNTNNLNALLQKNKFKLIYQRKITRGIWDVMDMIFQKELIVQKNKITTEYEKKLYSSSNIKRYYKIKKKFYNTKFNKKINNKKISIYGCGWLTTCFLTNFFKIDLKKISELVDADKRKFGLSFGDTIIKHPKNIKENFNTMLISTLDSYDEIKNYLKKMNKKNLKLISFINNKDSFIS
jgi:2-polyprenyl-3-methyl-5-hydroxy-6-metoxy-1,4-benzoquinol methylase